MALKEASASEALESEELSALVEQVGVSLSGRWTVKQLPETVTRTKMDGTVATDVCVTVSPLWQYSKMNKSFKRREGERDNVWRYSPTSRQLLQPPISLELNMCLFALSARYKN